MEEKRSNLGVLKELIPLFVTEIVLLTLLNFINLSIVYRFMAIALAAIAIVPIIKSLPRNKSLIPFILQSVTLFLYLFLSVIFGHIAIKDAFSVVIIVLGALGFYALGFYYGMFGDNKINISKVIAAFYIGIGLFTLICLITTLYGIGKPFYAVIYLNPIYSSQHELAEKARIVIDIIRDLDFSYSTPNNVGVAILANFALIASSGIYVTLFTDFKKDKFLWIGSLVGGVSGILTIILIPIFLDLIIFIFGLVACIIIKSKLKTAKYYLIYLGVAAAIIGILYMAFRLDNHFNPERYKNLNYVLEAILFQKIGIFKYFANLKHFFTLSPKFVGTSIGPEFNYISSGSILTDVLYQSGIFPLLCLLVFLGIGIYQIIKYIKNNDNLNVKVGIISIIVLFVVSLFINYVGIKLTENFVFLGVIFFMAYVTSYNLKNKNQIVIEENKEIEVETNKE